MENVEARIVCFSCPKTRRRCMTKHDIVFWDLRSRQTIMYLLEHVDLLLILCVEVVSRARRRPEQMSRHLQASKQGAP